MLRQTSLYYEKGGDRFYVIYEKKTRKTIVALGRKRFDFNNTIVDSVSHHILTVAIFLPNVWQRFRKKMMWPSPLPEK